MVVKGPIDVSVSEYAPAKLRLSKTHIFWATVKLTWFLIFSIGAIALSVTVAFSSYDATTSKVALSSIKPLDVINDLKGFFNENGSVIVSPDDQGYPAVGDGGEPNLELFALDELPYEYRFGMAGICRLYNISTPNTTCTRSLGSPPSILFVLTTDLNTTNPAALAQWTALLESSLVASPYLSGLLEREARASSALLLASICLTPFNVALTLYLFFRHRSHSLPKRLLPLYILDGLLMIASAGLYTHCIETWDVDTNIPNGISFSQGMLLFWVAAGAKLAVTPMMLVIALVSAVVLASVVAAAAAAGAGGGDGDQYETRIDTTEVWVPVDDGINY